MKKTIICLVVGLFLTAGIASAQSGYQAAIGADVHVGDLFFEHLFDNTEEGTKISLWELVVHGKLNPTPDLMLLFNHAVGNATKAKNADFAEGAGLATHYTQGALLYQFYDSEPLSVYAGLGYHFTHGHFKNLITQQEQPIKNAYLDGNGFTASSLVTFHVIEDLDINAIIQAAPWYGWSYRVGNSTHETRGSVYSYLLAADYSFKENLLIRVGYSGGWSGIGEFELADDYKINRTTIKQGGLQVGASYKF